MADRIEKVLVPDIGSATNVNVIEVMVKPGDKISADDSVITLEGDKASMDVPSPFAGEVTEVKVKQGNKVSEGDVILLIKVQGEAAKEEKKEEKKPEKPTAAKPTETVEKPTAASPPVTAREEEAEEEGDLHAGPGVRRIAREFTINLAKISGSGPKGRILKEDLQNYVKQRLQAAESGGVGGLSVIPLPKIDFAKFGSISKQPLSKIKKATAANLHRNWVTIPHITQFDEADITDMENFRKQHQAEAVKLGFKLTPLVFIMKAVVATLKKFPMFNSSLDETGENLIIKNYYHIGVAVDTPNGLVVPVIRDVDKKGLFVLAKELSEISAKARDKGLSLTDMQGGSFSISSLGGIGGAGFTPIINAPEVAILGVSKASLKLVAHDSDQFVPRLMLPLSLSYDHRVIDGADGARFITFLASRLADIGMLLL